MAHGDMATLPLPGETIADKYVVEGVIGEGGMGAVLGARHKQLGRRVAIKLLNSEALGHEEAVARFLREARASVAIKSEHVARVIDVGTHDNGAPYIVMEHLEGMDLQEVIAEEPLPPEVAIDYVLQACEAIAEAHHHKIIHRDLKPANLFLTRRTDGSHLVKVLDFGIAKALEHPSADAHLTTTGSALGTPIYMSPEQVRNAKNADMRTDVWGLGSILYHLLTGSPPYVADTVPALCAMIIADPYPPMLPLREELPEELDAVVARALEKDPKDRYASVAAFAEALVPFAAERSLVHVERILNMASGGQASLSGSWRARDSMADTVASRPGGKVVSSSKTSGKSALISSQALTTPIVASKAPAALDETAGSWQTGGRKSRPATLAAVAGVALLIGVGAWTLSHDDGVTPTESLPSEAAADPRGSDTAHAVEPQPQPAALPVTPASATTSAATTTTSAPVARPRTPPTVSAIPPVSKAPPDAPHPSSPPHAKGTKDSVLSERR